MINMLQIRMVEGGVLKTYWTLTGLWGSNPYCSVIVSAECWSKDIVS